MDEDSDYEPNSKEAENWFPSGLVRERETCPERDHCVQSYCLTRGIGVELYGL